MAVIEIMYHFKNERRGDARGLSSSKPSESASASRLVKLSADAVGRDDVGVGLHELKRPVAVEL